MSLWNIDELNIESRRVSLRMSVSYANRRPRGS